MNLKLAQNFLLKRTDISITVFLASLATLSLLFFPAVRPITLTEEYASLKNLGLELLSFEQGWGRIILGFYADEKPIYIDQIRDKHAFGVHANSRIVLRPLNKETPLNFQGRCSKGPHPNSPPTECQIFSDGRLLFKSSPLIHPNDGSSFLLNLDGSQTIELLYITTIDSNRSAHGSWHHLKVETNK